MAAGDPILSQLTEQTAPVGTDLIPLARGSANLQKVTAANLRAFVLAGSGAQTGLQVVTPSGDTTGSADTAAIQAALNTGNDVYISAGAYYTNANLNVTTLAQNGQKVYGAGSVSDAGNGANSTVIQPSAAVTACFYIDGTGIGSFIQNFGLTDLTIDMTNMTDAATSAAINQVQAFDCYYQNVRVRNYGTAKVSWLFSHGAYVTVLTTCQGGLVRFAGQSFANATTTITLNNCDFKWLDHTYYSNVTLVGGAIQRPYDATVPIVYLAPGTSPYGAPPNTGGIYVAVMSKIDNAQNFASIGCDWEQGGGYPATYNDGSHGVLSLYPVIQVTSGCTNSTFINGDFAGCYLYDQGTSTRAVSYQTGTPVDVANQRAFHLAEIAHSGTLTGFTNFNSYYASGATKTYQVTASTGSFIFLKGLVQPSADAANVFDVKASGGTLYFDVSTNGGGAVNVGNSAALNGYSDTLSTMAWDFTIPSAGTGLLHLRNGGSTTITLTGANGTVNVTNGYYVAGTAVVGARATGWGAASGTLGRAAYASYAGQTMGATYSQSAAQATDDGLKALAQRVAAIITDLTAHGLIGP